MDISRNIVGVDYHDKVVRVCILNKQGETLGNKDCPNSVMAVTEYIGKFGQVESVAIEACNGSANFADQLNRQTGWHVKLCHPGYVRRMKNNPDKSDKTDAQLIGDLNRVGYLPEVWLAPEELRDLRTLVRYRQQQVERFKAVKIRIRALLRHHRLSVPREYGLWSKKGLQWFRCLGGLPEHGAWILVRHLKEYEAAQEELKACLQRFEHKKEDRIVQELLKQKGIGLITAVIMRAEIGYFSRFKYGKQLSRFCGVTPRNASSGERQADAGLIKAGNSILKTAIIEAAQRLVRYDPEWNKFATQLRRKGKPTCVIIGAVANRWIRRLCYTMCEIEQTDLVRAEDLKQAA